MYILYTRVCVCVSVCVHAACMRMTCVRVRVCMYTVVFISIIVIIYFSSVLGVGPCGEMYGPVLKL